MSKGLNRVQLIGRLGADPDMRYTPQGSAVTNFRIATGGKWTDRDGNERDDTEWHRIEAWDRLAEIANQYLTKGGQVYVEGRLRTRKYRDREGIERLTTEIVATDLILLGGKNSNGAYSADGEADIDASLPPRSAQRPSNEPRTASRSEPSGSPGGRNQPQPIENDMNEDDIPF